MTDVGFDGSDIIGALLLADADLLAVVPAARIKAGALPENVGLPALLVTCTSAVERTPLVRGASTRTVDRISVTVRAASHAERKAVMGLVTACCAGKTGNIGGGTRVAIRPAGRGPDLRGPGNTFDRTADFRVSYDAAT
jgi:hypothetical protein